MLDDHEKTSLMRALDLEQDGDLRGHAHFIQAIKDEIRETAAASPETMNRDKLEDAMKSAMAKYHAVAISALTEHVAAVLNDARHGLIPQRSHYRVPLLESDR